MRTILWTASQDDKPINGLAKHGYVYVWFDAVEDMAMSRKTRRFLMPKEVKYCDFFINGINNQIDKLNDESGYVPVKHQKIKQYESLLDTLKYDMVRLYNMHRLSMSDVIYLNVIRIVSYITSNILQMLKKSKWEFCKYVLVFYVSYLDEFVTKYKKPFGLNRKRLIFTYCFLDSDSVIYD